MRRITVFLLAALMLTACSKQAPEVTAQEQVPADQRTEAAPAGGSEAAEGEAGDGGATWVTIDLEFAEAPTTLPAGETEITLQNDGAAPHDVTFEELGDETVAAAPGGDTEEGTAELEPGTYTYYCSVPGHREAGMEGTLTVE